MEQPAGTPIWPTTVGAVGVVVGGLQCYGGCVAIGGLDPISALHTATQLPGGDDPVLAALMAQGPPTDPNPLPIQPLLDIMSLTGPKKGL